jgi:hypothetical protein
MLQFDDTGNYALTALLFVNNSVWQILLAGAQVLAAQITLCVPAGYDR